MVSSYSFHLKFSFTLNCPCFYFKSAQTEHDKSDDLSCVGLTIDRKVQNGGVQLTGMSPAIRCLWYFTLFSPLRTAACSGVLPSLSRRLNRLPLKYPGASPAAETKVRCKNLVKNTNIRGKSHQLKVRKWYFLSDFSHYTLLKCHCKLVVNFSHYKTLPRQETKWLCTKDV